MDHTVKKIVIAVLLVLVAVVSFLLVADRASAQETHAATIESIDGKTETVLKLTASSTLASAAVSAIPGDTATPIAEKLADFTEYFLLILCVLYSEKYLLGLLGAGTFRILIPFACLLAGLGLFWNPKALNRLARKVAVFGLAIYFVIPFSIRVSDMIYAAYQTSFDAAISSAEQFSDETAGLAGEEEDKGILSTILNGLSETPSSLTEKATNLMNHFVESLAVIIVTSCIIPVLVGAPEHIKHGDQRWQKQQSNQNRRHSFLPGRPEQRPDELS